MGRHAGEYTALVLLQDSPKHVHKLPSPWRWRRYRLLKVQAAAVSTARYWHEVPLGVPEQLRAKGDVRLLWCVIGESGTEESTPTDYSMVATSVGWGCTWLAGASAMTSSPCLGDVR